jgi:hypothetical protein
MCCFNKLVHQKSLSTANPDMYLRHVTMGVPSAAKFMKNDLTRAMQEFLYLLTAGMALHH